MSLPRATSRRQFLKNSVATAGAAILAPYPSLAQSPAKYRRYNVTSPGGQIALASYARGILAMLALPPDHPQNWFRNAFIHLMDCPHGNWWFYVWHRGYLGYFEQTIRNLSGDATFALPYWDWTQLPQIPDGMFNGPLSPTDTSFAPFTKDIATFTSFIQPALKRYWNKLTSAQRTQLNRRGYGSFDSMWNDVTGFNPSLPPPQTDFANMAFASTPNARYLSRDNPNLTDDASYDVSQSVVSAGLQPTTFSDPNSLVNFASSKATSHNSSPGGNAVFSTLEGMPHNNLHNCIGGLPPIPNGPYGNMTNFLSPVDPIFFLHHSNMDRLWDIWTRKQQAQGLPYLPNKADLTAYQNEPFLFFVNGSGRQVGSTVAKDYLSTTKFQYDYEPGFGETLVKRNRTLLTSKPSSVIVKGVMNAHVATMMVPTSAVTAHLSANPSGALFALLTLPRPADTSSKRNFEVLVGAPPYVNQAKPGSPYYAGTVAFLGSMMHMEGMTEDATFVVPLPRQSEAYPAVHGTEVSGRVAVSIKVVPSGGGASVLKAATVQAL